MDYLKILVYATTAARFDSPYTKAHKTKYLITNVIGLNAPAEIYHYFFLFQYEYLFYRIASSSWSKRVYWLKKRDKMQLHSNEIKQRTSFAIILPFSFINEK